MTKLAVLGVAALLSMVGLAAFSQSSGALSYVVESTATFSANGVRQRQSIVSRCEVRRGLGGTEKRRQGDPHWIQQTDGSIIVVSSLDLCRFTKPVIIGETAALKFEGEDELPVVADKFDSTRNPTRLTELVLVAGKSGADGLSIDTVDVRVLDQVSPTSTLAEAFPGLSTIGPITGTFEAGAGATVKAGTFAGFQVDAFRLISAPQCAFSQDVVFIKWGSECDPTAKGPGLSDAESRHLGTLGLEASPNFQRLTILETAPDQRRNAILFSSTALSAAQAPLDRNGDWAPEICFRGRCEKASIGADVAVIFVPKDRLVVRVSGRHRTVSPDMYSSNQWW